MNNNLISIVMPCLNAQDYIEHAIYSVLNQGFQDYELIVMDGGSTDNTMSILVRHHSPRVKIVRGSDRGVADALNKGFALSKGGIFCWLNADDVYLSSRTLATVAERFAMASVDVVHGHSVAIDENGIVKKSQYSWTASYEEYLAGNVNMFTGSVFFDRSTWKDFGGFDAKYKVAFEYQFYDFLFRYKKRLLIDCFLAALRHHPKTLTMRNQSLLRMELDQMRGRNHFPISAFRQKIKRLAGHIRDKNLIRVIRNTYFDRYAGRYWLDLFNDVRMPR